MTREPNKNQAASIRARLLSLSQEKGEDYQRVLGRFAIERFLYRLGNSSYRDRFVLKGATLFTLWTGATHRPTKDLDLLGWGSSEIADVEQAIRVISELQEDDGIFFDSKSIEGERIKEDDEYDGIRIKFRAELAGARIPLQIDIGFGDAVYPEPELAAFPVLLQMSVPVIRAYPREASIAEKLHAMVERDIRNSRMKDFYDICFMANTWTFQLASLRSAITVSFQRRGSTLTNEIPFALTNEFLTDAQKMLQWKAFAGRLNPSDKVPSLAEVGAVLRAFLLPCLSAQTDTAALIWTPNRGWHDSAS
ncbi:nucleotidyl transferase AbiEii/AbiGii toxin family protein [Edaphobacter sp. HDX4]|uniref:nucleotidyl transferase AbiEii/AbiGii toxin family protein n=1 Tax=Edaphobacter sp. HDX4 TaxID=2794064 RepID=UPI002FE5BF07